jgi:hypothetical protein
MTHEEKIDSAVAQWGRGVVLDVLNILSFMEGDPDGVWSTYQDMGMFEHSEVVEYIYFDN